jgi:hypothetical protein
LDTAAAEAKMIEGLQEKTGKSLEGWRKLLAAGPPRKHGEIVAWLKAEHGVTHGFANLIAHKHLASDAASLDSADLVAAQYAGAKAVLRPIYEALVASISGFGGDVELAPKKGYVSVRRKKQFATLHPSTATRFDVGLQLRGEPPRGRLEVAGAWNAMVSHRVRLESLAEVDAELVAWLRRAYEAAG